MRVLIPQAGTCQLILEIIPLAQSNWAAKNITCVFLIPLSLAYERADGYQEYMKIQEHCFTIMDSLHITTSIAP